MSRLLAIVAGILGALVINGAGAEEVLIDFESPVSASGDQLPGNTYSALGVTFSTVLLNDAPVVGETRFLAPVSDSFRMYRSDDAISGLQFAGPHLGGGANDLLMHFSTPITQISVVSDDTGAELPQTIRLIALSQLAAGYRVLDFVAGLDDATQSPDNLLQLDLGGASFSDVLFEVTTEQEGFDDLRFTTVAQIPEPASLALLGGVALSGLLVGRRRRRGRQGP
jgi:hypothetical protein